MQIYLKRPLYKCALCENAHTFFVLLRHRDLSHTRYSQDPEKTFEAQFHKPYFQ